jgi:hypothetical protein
MDDDEERMQLLMPDCVNIGNTHYGQEAALKERELEAVVYTMSREKRNELQRMLVELEVKPISADASQAAQVTVSTDSKTGAV